MKLKKKFIRHIYIDSYDVDQLVSFFNELGFTLYEDPSAPELIFISNIPLTWGWLRRNHKRYQIDKSWLNDNFVDVKNKTELDEIKA